MKSSRILIKGLPAMGRALSRFAKTKKIDSIAVELLAQYRKSAKRG
jgi:hypothetical protein